MRVYFYDRPISSDLFADAAGREKQIHGTLTTDHAASSYGLPVVVADNGTVYGPAESHGLADLQGAAHLHTGLVDAARSAGYAIECPTYPAKS